MTNKDFKEGMEVTCEYNGDKLNGTLIPLNWGRGIEWYISGTNKIIHTSAVTNLQPKPRTIDDLECGDIIVDVGGWKRKCLGKCGEVYAISANWNKTTDNADKIFSALWTIYQLKRCDYTLYQPTEAKETDIDEVTLDKCIKVVEDFFGEPYREGESMKKSLVQALKKLKK